MIALPPTTPILAMSLALDTAWPAWGIGLAILAILVLVGWTYQAAGQRSNRARLLAILRAAAALLLLAILARPTLILSRQLKPKPVLTIAIDTSASMARHDIAPEGTLVADAPAGAMALRSAAEPDHASPIPEPLTRLAAVIARLTDRQGALLQQLAQRYQVQLAAVGDRVISRHVIDAPRQVPDAHTWLGNLKPDASRTDLAGSVHELLASTEPDRTLAGLALLSDGRRNAGAPLSTAAQALYASGGAAIAVAVGSDAPPPDLRLSDVQAPTRAFVGEPVAIRGRLEGSGLSLAVSGSLKLIDESTGNVLAEKSIAVEPPTATRPAASSEFALMYQPDKQGVARLVIEVDSPLNELDLRNNRVTLQVEAVDAKIRVLYVEREARFEYRYLKNLLVREPTVISSVLLLAADPDFPQEGTEPIRRFPSSLEELDRYDVILLGDIDPKAGWIDTQGLENLAKWVEQKGGGLGWMAGARNDLKAWHGTPLGKVLPVRPAESSPAQLPAIEPFRPSLTAEGAASSIFFLDAKGTPPAQVVADLPEWHWIAPIGRATPAAMALAVHPQRRSADGPLPLVVVGHYGAGQTFYCGSDEMWRWRRFRDIDHWRAFWLQTVRWLAAPRKLGAYRKVAFEAIPAKVQAGQPTNLDLRVHDETLAGDLPERLSATIRQGASPVQSVWLQRPPGLAAYSAAVSLDRAGAYTAEVKLPTATQPAIAAFDVQLPEAETADSPADPAALRQWIQAVEQAGGQAHLLELDNLDDLASLPLPPAQVKLQTIDLRLWDNWLALLLVTGLFLGEWAWRRARGMA
jgi:hypothetical protein